MAHRCARLWWVMLRHVAFPIAKDAGPEQWVCRSLTPTIGHVFHEQCLLEWFRSQSQAYIAQQREQGHRASSPSVSEAPAECPTCRAECYADQDTGNPQIHRLYINFGDGATAGGSSQVGSSPVRTPWKDRSKGKGREGRADAEVMGWAKRARGISVEVRDLAEEGKEVGEDDIGGVLRRAEALKEDLISQKAVEGIRVSIASHPTPVATCPDLQWKLGARR